MAKGKTASSDEQPTDRISTDLLERLTKRVHVDSLTRWEGDPWAYDEDAAAALDARFGKLRLPVVINGEVVYGADIYEAERRKLLDGGEIMVVDLTEAGWSAEQARAWAVGRMSLDRDATIDDELMASALLAIREFDETMPAQIGWDDESLHNLMVRSGMFADAGTAFLNDLEPTTSGNPSKAAAPAPGVAPVVAPPPMVPGATTPIVPVNMSPNGAINPALNDNQPEVSITLSMTPEQRQFVLGVLRQAQIQYSTATLGETLVRMFEALAQPAAAEVE